MIFTDSPSAFARTDEFWDAWSFAAVEVELSFAAWKRAARELKATAFATYRSALDREEAAAVLLAARVGA